MLSCIAVMHMWGNKLVINLLLNHEVLENLGAFIVESLQHQFVSCCAQLFVNNFVCSQNAVCGLVFHWFGMNAVGILVVHDKQILIALVRGSNKVSSLVRVYLTGDFHGKKHM